MSVKMFDRDFADTLRAAMAYDKAKYGRANVMTGMATARCAAGSVADSIKALASDRKVA